MDRGAWRATVHGVVRVRHSLAKKWKVKVKLFRVRLFATPWAVAHQAPPSMEFSRQEYWSGLPFPSPGDLPDPGIEPGSPTLQADAFTIWATRDKKGKGKKVRGGRELWWFPGFLSLAVYMPAKSFSPVWLFATLWTVANQAPLSR